MQQIIENFKQLLSQQHVDNEKIKNIINSIDINQINLQDLSSTTSYLSRLLTSAGLEEGAINSIISNLANNFGIDGISKLGVNKDDVLGTVKNVFGGLLGGE